jgi:hypothetical protein
MPLGGQPFSDGLQIGGVSPVHGDHQRFARCDDLGGEPVQKPVVPEGQRLQAQLQQALLTGPALAVRGEHAAGHPGGTPLRGAVHAHGPAVKRRTARDGQSDDAAADDCQRSLRHNLSLRRHDPDQV